MFDHLYAELPEAYAKQREELQETELQEKELEENTPAGKPHA
jgi:hypothetical protein